MTEPEFGHANRPRVGDIVKYRGEPHGKVLHLDGDLCWVEYLKPHGQKSGPFIWRFTREKLLNSLHDWPGKEDVPVRQPDGTCARVPVANFGARTHHPRCPTRPGQPLASDTICCDCIDGAEAEKAEKRSKVSP